MGEKLQFFQYGILILFGVFALIGLIFIATKKNPAGQTEILSQVVVWGPSFGEKAFQSLIEKERNTNKSFEKVMYVEKDPATLYGELLEAIATGNGPDLVILDSSLLLPLKNKIQPIPFESFPLASYKSAFVDGAEIFLFSDGVYALPLFVDPLVLYWNRDLFTKNGIADVPKEWDSFVQIVPRLSKIVSGSTLQESAISFGEYDNVLHAKDILSALYLQAGASIVVKNSGTDQLTVDLASSNISSKTAQAIKFYTSFSNPKGIVYSWNKTFDRSREVFAANKLAMYAGLISEYSSIANSNPNLNFEPALFPQITNTVSNRTYGKFYGIAMLKSSKNMAQAYKVASFFVSKSASEYLTEKSNLPSVRRDILTQANADDPTALIKTQSALMARGWLEPDQSEVETLFRRAINNTVSGITTPEMGNGQLAADIEELLEDYK